MKEIKELLSAAREAIDGSVSVDVPGVYSALDHLERAISILVQKVQDMDKELYRVQNPNP